MTNGLDTAYFDCFSGISGDMLLGALVDCGLDVNRLRSTLAALPLEPWDLAVNRCTRRGIGATAVTVTSPSGQTLRTLDDITAMLDQSSLQQPVIEQSLRVLRRLAQAEAHVHDISIEQIHFHEIGAIDTIIDIVGVVWGLQELGIRSVSCSPLPLARGFVSCAHGNLPLPAPAVCELLRDIPVVGCASDRELVTPTGAALVAELADTFGPLPAMRLLKTGYGAGSAEGEPLCPNLLRLFIGRQTTPEEPQRIEVIETHLDDWHTEGFPLLCERLFAQRALDVSLTPMQMKKGRPGFCLRVIVAPAHSAAIKELILNETSAIGLRFRTEERMTLPRRAVSIATRWGAITAKEVQTPSGTRVYPEYEACRRVAEAHRVPLERIYRDVVVAAETKR